MESLLEQPAASSLLTPDEAARILTVAPGTLMIWRSTGRYSLPFTKVGGAVRYRLEDLEQFLRSRTVDPSVDSDAKLRASLDLRSTERERSHKARGGKKKRAVRR